MSDRSDSLVSTCNRQKPPLVQGVDHVRSGSTAVSKGFGRRQTYESLTCRNPRAAWDLLRGFRLGWVAGSVYRSAIVVAIWPDRVDDRAHLMGGCGDLADD
ncbi:MAG: hypothetical protein WBO17_00425, partial [Sphingorhabdus sp.]